MDTKIDVTEFTDVLQVTQREISKLQTTEPTGTVYQLLLREYRAETYIFQNRLLGMVSNKKNELIRRIKSAKCSKAFISIPGPASCGTTEYEQYIKLRINKLEETVKTLLTVFDTIVIVPAPLAVDCLGYNIEEFSYGGISHDGVFISDAYREIVLRFCLAHPYLVYYGAIIPLPLIGNSENRWCHSAFNLPPMPKPYSGNPYGKTKDAECENLVNLLLERIVAEKLGCVHINPHSFDRPYIGDLALPAEKELGRAIVELKVPYLQDIDLRTLLILRESLCDQRHQFANFVFDAIRSNPSKSIEVFEELEKRFLAIKAEYLKLQQETFGTTAQIIIGSVVFAMSVNGDFGTYGPTLQYVLGGSGALYKLVPLILKYRKYQLKVNDGSYFYLAKIKQYGQNESE